MAARRRSLRERLPTMTLGGFRWRALALGVCLVCAAIAGCGDEWPPAAEVPAAPPAGNGDALVDVGCTEGQPSPERTRRSDLPVGRLVLMGIDERGVRPRQRQAGIDRPPDAFGGHGYKVPVSLLNGTSAVLSVPRFERGRLGLVFTQQAQRRVLRHGVAGADRAIRFTACPAGGAPGRTGWPGGFVVDDRHCATVTVNPGRSPARNFGLPLGRPCPPSR